MTRLIGLYPQTWRDRYEVEFLALLAERPPDPMDRLDIVRGAIDARLHPPPFGAPEPPEPLPYSGPWTVRRAGGLTLLGAFLWLVTIGIAINGPLVRDGDVTYRDPSAATLTFFLSLILLLFGIWTVAATLPSTSHLARTAALIAGLAGLFWAFVPWMILSAVVLCLGVTILAVEAARTRRWRQSDVAVLVTGMAAAVGLIAVDLTGGPLPVGDHEVQFTVLLMLGTLWLAIADALLRPAMPIAAAA